MREVIINSISFYLFKLNLALGMVLIFYANVAKGLKLKVRKFCWLTLTFEKVTGETLCTSPLPIQNRVNGQTSFLKLLKSTVPQGSVLGHLMILIYINGLPDNIQSTCKIFADDTSLFSHVSDKSTSQIELNKDLQAISNWTS